MHSALNGSGKLGSQKAAQHPRRSQRMRSRSTATARETCRHYISCYNGPRGCFNDGRCGDCNFDEVISAVRSRYDASRASNVISVEGFSVQADTYMHHGHMWLRRSVASEAVVGLDSFASSLIGPPDHIAMPETGTLVLKGDPLVTVTRQGKLAHLLAPISGLVTAINRRLKPKTTLQRRNGVPNAWLVRLHTNHMRRALKELLKGKRLVAFLQHEVECLFKDIETVAGPLSADGGLLGEDIYGNLPELGWEKLSARYLRN
jgi:glycine cleavage system H lipoate-binding protein